MFKTSRQKNEDLDLIGKVILRSAAAKEEDVEAAASSPFLFTRVRAAITAEQRLQEESGSWLSLILVARRAVPAMALVAILAAVLTVWSAGPALSGAQAQADEEGLPMLLEPGVEQAVLASRGLSRDDVFNIVVDRNYEVKGK
jgi:broad specificity phosphatase PhoE